MKLRLALFGGLVLVGILAAAPVHAGSKDATSQEVAYGAGSFFGTLLYAITPSALKGQEPVKFVGDR
jgi:hypothetical protein